MKNNAFSFIFRNHYHDLISLGAQFVVLLFSQFTRGKDRITYLAKEGWYLKEMEGFQAYIKNLSATGDGAHEDYKGDENDFAIIPDLELANVQFNPAVYFGLYLEFLNPENPRLFQRTQRDSKDFQIHDLRNMCLFELSPVGLNKLDKMLKHLCEIVEKPGNFGNASIWATGTQLLESAGFDERIIKMFSSHERNDLFTNSDSTQESDFNIQMESIH